MNDAWILLAVIVAASIFDIWIWWTMLGGTPVCPGRGSPKVGRRGMGEPVKNFLGWASLAIVFACAILSVVVSLVAVSVEVMAGMAFSVILLLLFAIFDEWRQPS